MGVSVVWACNCSDIQKSSKCVVQNYNACFKYLSVEKSYTISIWRSRWGYLENLLNNVSKIHGNESGGKTHSPPFRQLTEAETKLLLIMINRVNPDVFGSVWVYAQARVWMGEHFGRIMAPLNDGVGAPLIFCQGGRSDHQKKWMQHAGLEWLFSLSSS